MGSIGAILSKSGAEALIWASTASRQLVSISLVSSLQKISWIFEDVLVFVLVVISIGTIACCVALWKNYYSTALKVSAARKLREGKPMKESDKKFKVALDAEVAVQKLLEEEGWKYVFPNRRVAVSRLGHNREIDVIAIGPRILVIEVKHWRGFVWSSGSAWYQCPHRKAQALMFENVYTDNVEKAAALRRFIENNRRIPLPDGKGVLLSPTTEEGWEAEREEKKNTHHTHSPDVAGASPTIGGGTWYSNHSLHTQCGTVVVPVVVFTNPCVILDPNTILRENEHVFTPDSFRLYLRKLAWEDQQRSVLWSWWGGKKFSSLLGRPSTHPTDHIQEGPTEASSPSAPFKKKSKKKSKNDNPPPSAASPEADMPPTEASKGKKKNVKEKVPSVVLSAEMQRKVAEAVDLLRTWDVLQLHDGTVMTGDVQAVIAPSAFCSYERKHVLEMRLDWNSGWFGLVKTFLMNRSGTVKIILSSEKRLAVKKNEKKPRDAKGNIVFPCRPRHKKVGASDRVIVRSPGVTHLITVLMTDVKEISFSKHLYLTENLVNDS